LVSSRVSIAPSSQRILLRNFFASAGNDLRLRAARCKHVWRAACISNAVKTRSQTQQRRDRKRGASPQVESHETNEVACRKHRGGQFSTEGHAMFATTNQSSNTPTTVASPARVNPVGAQMSCMVIGFSEERRHALAAAAAAAGWDVVQCDDPKTARIQLLREPQQMVIVDLEDECGNAPESLKRLTERINQQKTLLVTICGNAGDPAEEIWARQQGVWLYLPGVVADDGLSSLFEEGGQVASWRSARAEREAYFPTGYTASA
jgi:hypothetical protein